MEPTGERDDITKVVGQAVSQLLGIAKDHEMESRVLKSFLSCV